MMRHTLLHIFCPDRGRIVTIAHVRQHFSIQARAFLVGQVVWNASKNGNDFAVGALRRQSMPLHFSSNSDFLLPTHRPSKRSILS